MDLTYFDTRTYDALIQVRYPPSQGFLNRQLENIGEVHNSGLEVRTEVGLIRSAKVDWRGRVNITRTSSEATDLGDEAVITAGGTFTEVRKGYPVTSLFSRKVLNASALAAPIVSDTNVFIGQTFPDRVYGFGSTLTLWDKLTLDGLGEFQLGGYNINSVGYQNALRGNWRPCYAIQEKMVAAIKTNNPALLNDVKALDRTRCAVDRTQQFFDAWVEKADFFRLRYLTATYRLPSRLVRGLQGASLSFSGRNLFYSSDYSGLDPESADQADSQVGRREYYQLPQLRSFQLSFRANW
jgi:hypothetical protein